VSRTLFKLRIFGIVTFFLFIISMLFEFPPGARFNFNRIQQILILLSFIIFAILMLLQLYGFYRKSFLNEKENEDS